MTDDKLKELEDLIREADQALEFGEIDLGSMMLDLITSYRELQKIVDEWGSDYENLSEKAIRHEDDKKELLASLRQLNKEWEKWKTTSNFTPTRFFELSKCIDSATQVYTKHSTDTEVKE
ncbi:hypothetical protein LCGC14_2918100 [marine sediment metagenome]|uniref:Uncharacterized protein n=1 Tax=marine sediment metagenome TaxID=412755 RepID=A0A0F8XPX7_9ZZZZ